MNSSWPIHRSKYQCPESHQAESSQPLTKNSGRTPISSYGQEDEIVRSDLVCKLGPIYQWVLTEYETKGALFMTGLRIIAK